MQFTRNDEQTLSGYLLGASRGREKQVFIVHCQPCTPHGATKIITATKKAALEAATDFLNDGVRFVAISDGRLLQGGRIRHEDSRSVRAVSLTLTEGAVRTGLTELLELEEMIGELTSLLRR
jgi:hypothetical protein